MIQLRSRAGQLALVGALALAAGCSQDQTSGGGPGLKAENEKLKKESSQKDSTIKKFIGSFNQIINNLGTITETQKAIAGKVKNRRKLNKDDKAKISAYVDTINVLIEQNKQITESMRNTFSLSHLNFTEIDTMMSVLCRQVDHKNSEINNLKRNLQDADTDFESMNFLLDQVTTLNVEMEEKMKQLEAVIETQKQELHTGYYIIGSYKELKDAGVVSKSGLTKVEGPAKDFSTAKFLKIDITQATKINTWSATSRLLTHHPSASYKMERNTLMITQPEEFWKITKYLVIMKE